MSSVQVPRRTTEGTVPVHRLGRTLAARRRTRSVAAGLSTLLLAGGVAALTGVGAAQAAETWNGRLVLDQGHVDAFHVTLEGGDLALRLREDVTGDDVVHDPADVALQVTDAGQIAVPDVPGYEFLGEPGDTVWMIPEIQDPAVVWAGWDTETIPLGALQGDTTTLSLTAARGPGEVHVFDSGPTGEAHIIFDPIDGPRSTAFRAGPGNHAHANWTFSAPGTYELDVTAEAVRADGASLQAMDTYVVVVGALPSDGGGTPTDPTPTDPPPGPTPTDPPPGPAPTDPGTGQPQQPAPGWGSLPASGRHVLDRGHVDIRSELTASGLRLVVRDDTSSPPVDHAAGAATLVAAPGAKVTNPVLEKVFGAGTTTAWVLPQTQVAELLWPGWNVGFGAGTTATAVRWELLGTRGPGEVSIFQSRLAADPVVLLGSVPGSPTSIEFREHAHGNWAFSAEGVYCLDSRFSAVGGPGSQTATLLVAVGAVDPAKVTEQMCGRTPEQIAGAPASGATPPPVAPLDPGLPPVPVGSVGGTPPAAVPPVSTTPACTPVPVTRRSAAVVASSGHFDLGAQVANGALVGLVKDDRSGTTWRDPAGVVFHMSDATRVGVPAGASYTFLGAAGTPVWLASQTQQAGVPWLGWNTQHPTLMAAVRGGVTFSLGSVSGPGRVEVFSTDSFGGVGQRIFSSGGGPKSLTVPMNTHQHANWAFTAPGVYRVPITQSATLNSGSRVSASAVLTFSVGPGNPAAAGGSATVTDYVGRTADGRECVLDAGQRGGLRNASAGAALDLAALGEIAQLPVVEELAAVSSDRDTARSVRARAREEATAAAAAERPWPLVALTAGGLTALVAGGTLWFRRRPMV
ncbi:TIGR03773 family transporter-associated surface protein [Blastococcus haudaquaticus]|nr:TIGR03773 family transporter-associated surface protein [Blastococcus haudaquaticus]